MKENKLLYKAIVLMLLFSVAFQIKAQDVENDFQTRMAFEMTYKPIKKFKLSFEPEFRFDENYAMDKFLIDSEVSYKLVKFLSLEAGYRFLVNRRENKDTQYLNRYSFSAKFKKKISRIESAFRFRYSNFADDEILDEDFFRYKLALKYDIAKCKLTPFVSAEAFQNISSSSLYKMRYGIGADFKLFKRNYLGLSYKFDYYKGEYRNKHIISVGYKFNL